MKGANGERELAALLMEWGEGAGMSLALRRNLEQVRNGGHDLTGLEAQGLAVECKRVEALAIRSWWDQAVRQADAVGAVPVLAWRQNRKPWRFRVRAWVWPCKDPLDVDLEADQFKRWFHAVLEHLPTQ